MTLEYWAPTGTSYVGTVFIQLIHLSSSGLKDRSKTL